MWVWEHLDLLFFGPRSRAATAGGAVLRVLRYPYAITRDLLASGEITLRAMSLVFAAHALGFAANWITEWYAYDRAVLDEIGLAPHERIAGFIHVGRHPSPAEDRPRPPLSQIVTRYGT